MQVTWESIPGTTSPMLLLNIQRNEIVGSYDESLASQSKATVEKYFSAVPESFISAHTPEAGN